MKNELQLGKSIYYLLGFFCVLGFSVIQSNAQNMMIADFEVDGVAPQLVLAYDFGTVTSETGMLENPNKSGINTSDGVFKMCKAPNTKKWAGFRIEPDTLNSTFNLSEGTVFCVDVLMPTEGIVQFIVAEFDTDDDDYKTKLTENYTTAGEWQQLCFDFIETNAEFGGPFRRISMQPNKGIKPGTEECYYFDNVVFDKLSSVSNNISALENFNLFPNPATNRLTISSDTPIASAIIYDIAGREVKQVSNPLDNAINIDYLDKGIYIIKMLNDSKVLIGSARFIKK